MKSAPIPLNEPERISNLLSYGILDTPPEHDYDGLTSLASLICETPIALVTLVDKNRTWAKSKVGMDVSESPREHSFCSHALENSQILEIPDTLLDERFKDSPLVQKHNVRFYAGAPLVSSEGFILGTICVIDQNPKSLTDQQKSHLKILSRQIIKNFELRKSSALIQGHEEKLVNLYKMSSLGMMAASVGHEINNLLSIIQNTSTLLARKIKKRSPLEELLPGLKKIDETASRMGKVIKGISSYTRNTEKDPFEPVSLRKLMEETLSLCEQKRYLMSIDIKMSVPEEDCLFECRSSQISQVIVNLLNNAMDAVETQNNPWIKIEVSLEKDNSWLKFRFTDSGPGIPEEVSSKLMQPFFTTKKSGKGTGLGLSISHSIIESHHGFLFMDETSPYTSFVFELPLVQKA